MMTERVGLTMKEAMGMEKSISQRYFIVGKN